MNRATLKLFALCGVLGPVLFTVMTILCAGLRSEFSHLHQFISELGATGTPNSIWMNYAGFVPTGLMIFLFGVALFLQRMRPIIWPLGSGLMAVFGFGIFMAGLFSCDQGCPDLGSVESNIHQTIAPITFLSAIFGIALLGISFRRFPDWRRLWTYSVMSSAVSFGLMLALVNSLETRMFTGLWQRLLLLVLFSWTAVIGFHFFKIKDSRSPK